MIYRFREQYGWLSNMKTANIKYKGHDFKSTENAFMWQKMLMILHGYKSV